MAGAVGMALGRRKPAVSEVSASGVAEGPSAGRLPDVLEPYPSHGADLGVGKGPNLIPPARSPRPGVVGEPRSGQSTRAPRP